MQTVRMLITAGLAACVLSAVVRPPPDGLSWEEARLRVSEEMHRAGRGFTRRYPPELGLSDRLPTVPPEEAARAAREAERLHDHLGPYAPSRGSVLVAKALVAAESGPSPEGEAWAREAQEWGLRSLWMDGGGAFGYVDYLKALGRPGEALETLRTEVLPRIAREAGGTRSPRYRHGVRLQRQLVALIEKEEGGPR